MKERWFVRVFFSSCLALVFVLASCSLNPTETAQSTSTEGRCFAPGQGSYVVLAYNDLGMHCMNRDFSEFMILPPYNTLHAQVMRTDGKKPQVVTAGIRVSYSVPGNTRSAGKTNFWDYCLSLLGVGLAPNVGLTGHRLSGEMAVAGGNDWVVTGIPLTPITDSGTTDPFQLASVVVANSRGGKLASTRAVVPVSWELRCDLCHHGAPDAPVSVLDAHDRLHGTALYNPTNQTPVLCGSCHAQIELGLPGQQSRASLSLAIHNAHSSRMMDVMDAVPNGVVCYACHPGVQTQCLRDVHARRQMNCSSCHAGRTSDWETAMLAVGDSSRQPWVTEPRCDSCHNRPGHEYEQPGVLFRNSKGHGGLYCEACHNSTHAITPAQDWQDNLQSVSLQHYAGPIRKCSICHERQPAGPMPHRLPRKS